MSHRTLRPFLPLSLLALAVPVLAHESEEQKILASDGASGDAFGRAVSVHHGLLAVGAPGAFVGADRIGAAYVFHHDGAEFHEEAKLVPSDGADGDQFGFAVSAAHGRVLVGAPGHDNGSGAVYVFEEVAGVWMEVAKLRPDFPFALEGFGTSLAMEDEAAVIGAPFAAPGGVGGAYVFTESLGVWSQAQKLQASDGNVGHLFGTSVAMEGASIVVGAIQAPGRVAKTGAAYVFESDGSTWSQVAKLVDPNGNASDFFGNSVAVSKGTLLVGAPGDDDTGASSGSIFDYRYTSAGITPRIKRLGLAGDALGASVAQSWHVTIGGSRLNDDEGPNAGAAKIWARYVFTTGFQIYVASDAEGNDFLGSAVSTDSCMVAAGAIGDDELGLDAGAVYAYVTAHPSTDPVNGSGVNPLCMTTVEAPLLGHHWVIEVDSAAVPGAAWTQVLVHYLFAPNPIATSFGEILVDRTSPMILNSLLPASGGIVTHELEIPDDPFLTGLDVAAQAVLRGSNFTPIGLCNAESARIGCHEEGHGHTN